VFRIKTDRLIKSADKIAKASENSIIEYMEEIDVIAGKLNDTMLKREDILELIGGEKNINMMKYNHINQLSFFASILQTPNPETLVETILWEICAHMSRGFSSKYWIVELNTCIQTIKEYIPEKAFLEIATIYEWFIVNISLFTKIAIEKLEKSHHY